jgi:hypothetical protein
MNNEQLTDKAAQLMTSLEREWHELADRQAESIVEADEGRAGLLARYEIDGLTQHELAVSIKVTQAHVVHLLRYHRFLITAVIKIPEGTFRAYWQQVSDPQSLRQLRGEKHQGERETYEATCFEAIAQMVAEGRKPLRRKRVKKPPTPGDIQGVKQVTKALRDVYGRLEPTLTYLKGLMRCDRSTFAPGSIAGHSQVLEREVKEFFKLAAGAEVE